MKVDLPELNSPCLRKGKTHGRNKIIREHSSATIMEVTVTVNEQDVLNINLRLHHTINRECSYNELTRGVEDSKSYFH